MHIKRKGREDIKQFQKVDYSNPSGCDVQLQLPHVSR